MLVWNKFFLYFLPTLRKIHIALLKLLAHYNELKKTLILSACLFNKNSELTSLSNCLPLHFVQSYAIFAEYMCRQLKKNTFGRFSYSDLLVFGCILNKYYFLISLFVNNLFTILWIKDQNHLCFQNHKNCVKASNLHLKIIFMNYYYGVIMIIIFKIFEGPILTKKWESEKN